MEKLEMCRICLARNVPMYVVANKHLHELYEKLSNIPFVAEDRKPILACSFCCAKLKNSFRLMRQCLEAEELLALMMIEDYEPKPLINLEPFKFHNGFIITPVEQISIVDRCQTESIAIKQELPADCEGLEDIKEDQSDEYVKTEYVDHSESDSVDVPILDFKIEMEEVVEQPKTKRRAVETNNIKPERIDNRCLDLADTPALHSESEDDVSLIVFKTEVEEAIETNSARVARKTKLEDTAKLKKNEQSNVPFRTTQNRTLEPGTSVEQPDRSLSEVKQRNVERFKCHVCHRNFTQKGNLADHVRIHTGLKPFKCDVCQSSFRRKGHLTIHYRKHTGEKPYKCDVCQLSFTQKTHLTDHVRIHTGLKPYECDVCQRSFTRKAYLTNHVRIHTGLKPYKCDVCQSSFRAKNDLTKHYRTHTGEKPYKCDVCQRCFTQKCHLTDHVLTHTGLKKQAKKETNNIF